MDNQQARADELLVMAREAASRLGSFCMTEDSYRLCASELARAFSELDSGLTANMRAPGAWQASLYGRLSTLITLVCELVGEGSPVSGRVAWLSVNPEHVVKGIKEWVIRVTADTADAERRKWAAILRGRAVSPISLLFRLAQCIEENDSRLDLVRLHGLADPLITGATPPPAPVPMRLPCPSCHNLHLDEGEFATKPHHTHACQTCGEVWRPAVVPTVGVRFLPGFKNEVDSMAAQAGRRSDLLGLGGQRSRPT